MGTSITQQTRFIIILLLVFCTTGCTEYKPAYQKMKNSDGKKEFPKRKDFFKEYALCSCLSQIHSNDSSKIKDASIGVYYELSDDDLIIGDAGKKIDSNAALFIKNNNALSTRRYENRKTPIMDCITYYKSRSLDNFIQSLIKDIKNTKK